MVSQWFHFKQIPLLAEVSLSQFVQMYLSEKSESSVVVVVADVVRSLCRVWYSS